MNLWHKSHKLIITGASGTGKSTYFSRYVLNSFGELYGKVFVFDHTGEHAYRFGVEPATDEASLVSAYEVGFVLFDPSLLFPGETEEAWNFFCEWTFDRCKANAGFAKLIAVDELQIFSSTAQVSYELSCVVETGRKYELDFCAISQQFNLIHNRLRNQATELVVFRQMDPLILDALADKGFDPEEVLALPDGAYINKSLVSGSQQTGQLFTCTDPPKRLSLSEPEAGSAECAEPEDGQQKT